MRLVYRATDQSPAYVEAFVTGNREQDFVDVDIPVNYTRMTVEEVVDLIDDLVAALQAIAKSYL